MRILLTGRNGQVGGELERSLSALGEVLATDRANLDLSDPDAICRRVRAAAPDVIVNAAAYTAVDRAEAEPALAHQVNGVAPGVLAEEAKRSGALLVHYSTDYVFDGTQTRPYAEDDATNPLNTYGRTKLEGERRIRDSGCRYLLLRASWVYGAHGNNFYLTIRRKAAAGERLRVVDDQTGVPSTAAFLARETVALLQAGASGLLHLVPNGATTWFGFARAIVEATAARCAVDAISSSEYTTAARRPGYSVLDNTRASRLLGRDFPHWRALLDECVKG